VSQTLFSASVIAEVLPRIYERDPEQGKQRLEELQQLTRGALAEMRTLLLELRPAALAEANLPDLLRQLGEAVAGRSRIPVDVQVDAAVDLPAEVGVALYRIAQEALNNVAKHSGAEHAHVTLRECGDDEFPVFELVVADDGCGFDPDVVRPGSLGLGIMTERAETIGARLEVGSVPGEGTRVRVVWHHNHLPRSPRVESSLQTVD
jgi:signal transduction histidine kinase